MIKNDYRRALIMLRSLAKGYSGFVRLERRTLVGTLQFTANGAANGANLVAVLLSQRSGGWFACKAGELRRDSRGQAGLNWSFDPRNVQGLELERYDLVTIVAVKGIECELVLAGFLHGAMEVNWSQVRDTACAVCAPSQQKRAREPASAPPAVDEPAREPEPAPIAQIVEVESAPESAEAPPAEAAREIEEPIEAVQVMAAPVETDEEPTLQAVCQLVPVEEQCVEVQAEEVEAEEVQAEEMPAAALLELDIDVPWPEMIEPLRPLFKREAAYTPFESEGFVFIRAPMPTESGISFCAAGIHVEDGKPTVVCFGIPAVRDVEPPPGLSSYLWRGDGQSGYWVIWQDAMTGETVSPP